MRFLNSAIAASVMHFGAQFPASAHSPGPDHPANIQWADGRDQFPPIDRNVVSSESAVPAEGPMHPFFLVILANRWKPSAKLRICFKGGSDQLRSKIIEVASQWLQFANLNFVTGGLAGQTCKSNDASEIRISFNEPGYWSYIGNDSISNFLISRDMSSMNFQAFDSSPPTEPRFSGIILHEFGHALGFHHEHQSPAEGCENEYDWPILLKVYKQDFGWDEQMTRDNLKTVDADRRAFDWSPPDNASIMAYATVDPSILKTGTSSPCFFKENDTLSEMDKKGALHTYPFENVSSNLAAQAAAVKALSPLTTGSLREALDNQAKILNSVDQP